MTKRVGLAIGLVVADVVLIVVPAVAILAAWVIITRPPAFRTFVEQLYATD